MSRFTGPCPCIYLPDGINLFLWLSNMHSPRRASGVIIVNTERAHQMPESELLFWMSLFMTNRSDESYSTNVYATVVAVLCVGTVFTCAISKVNIMWSAFALLYPIVLFVGMYSVGQSHQTTRSAVVRALGVAEIADPTHFFIEIQKKGGTTMVRNFARIALKERMCPISGGGE